MLLDWDAIDSTAELGFYAAATLCFGNIQVNLFEGYDDEIINVAIISDSLNLSPEQREKAYTLLLQDLKLQEALYGEDTKSFRGKITGPFDLEELYVDLHVARSIQESLGKHVFIAGDSQLESSASVLETCYEDDKDCVVEVGVAEEAIDIGYRDELIFSVDGLVEKIARRMIRRLPKNVLIEELIQEGYVGLIDAATRYEASRGVPFKAYAETRIRGTMIDSLRKDDLVPRSVRRKASKLEDARKAITLQGETPNRKNIIAYLGVNKDEYDDLVADAVIRKVVSMDASYKNEGDYSNIESALHHSLADPDAIGVEDIITKHQQRVLTQQAVEKLPARERQAIQLYCYSGRKLKEIGEILGVTESRACQLVKAAEKRLRLRLKYLLI